MSLNSRSGRWNPLAGGGCRSAALAGSVTLILAGGLQAQASVSELQIAPAQVELQLGERKSVLVTAFDRNGNVVPSVAFNISTEARVISVQQDNSAPNVLYVEGVGYGVTSLTIRTSGASAEASVRVADAPGSTPGPVGSGSATLLQIDPPNVFLLPTEEMTLGAVFLKDDGTPATRGAVSWTSLLQTVASVGKGGRIIGIAPGQGVVQAASGGLTARALVQVQNAALGFSVPRISLSPLQSVMASVTVPAQNNRPVSSRSVIWVSSNPRIINVSPVGEVTGIAPGSADIVVTGFGQQVRLPAVVHQPVELMLVTPNQGEVPVQLGGHTAFTARFEAGDGTEIPEASAIWSVADTGVAVYDDAHGRVVGKQLGTTTLKAVGPSSEFVAEWTLRVVTGGISVGAPRMSLQPTDSHKLVASFIDEGGTVVGEATGVTWSSSDPAVATVNDSGVVTAAGVGRAKVVISTSWGGGDSVDVFVQGSLLVTSTRSAGGDIYALDPRTPESLVRLTAGEGAEIGASYSPDGTRIAFVQTGHDGADIYTMNADGSDLQRVTTTPQGENYPQWTPDGNNIVFQVNEKNGTQIWIVAHDGSDPKPLTKTRYSNDQPAVSPDGNTIAYRSMADSKRNLYLMDIDGSNPRPVTDSETDYRHPRWLDDGTIALIADRRVDKEILRGVYRMDLATQTMEPLTPDSLWINEFDVTSDGARVAAIVQEQVENRQILKLFLIEGETVREVPRVSDEELFLLPGFKR